MKHTLIVDDNTHHGKLILEVINAMHQSDNAVAFLNEDSQELIPIDLAFDEFDKALDEEYKK